MDLGLLYEPPFTDIHQDGIEGIFKDESVENIINLIQSINKTAAINSYKANITL